MKTDEEIMSKYWFFQPDYALQNNLMAFGFECGPGWYDLIEELCDKISVLLDTKYPEFKTEIEEEDRYQGQFQVTQVKEKFGTLRFYVSTAPDEVFDLIDEAEKKSAITCEHCGNPGSMREHHMWLSTLCDECDSKIAP